jgi:UDP-3-O-acyl N-acetylglucosamine deacetylase
VTADRRRTIARPIGLEGIGLHLGQQSRLTFRPAPDGAGVVFRRIDLDGGPEIPARIAHARLTERRTSLGLGIAELHTVEHVLAAIAGAAIDDVIIEIDGPEPPILDGSAGPFWDALLEAGTVERATAADYLELPEPVRVIDGESVYEAHPASDLELDVTIDFPHPVIGRQHGEYVITPSSFARDLARARTFGFLTEVETLRGKGLIQGASTANTVVLDEARTIDTVLRWPDEFVRHKALDCLGD